MIFYSDGRKIRDYKPGLVLIDFEDDWTKLKEYANVKDFSWAVMDAYMLKDGKIFDIKANQTFTYKKTIFTQNGFCEIRRKENSNLLWGYFDPENMSYDQNKMRIIKLEDGMIYDIMPTYIRVYKCKEEEEKMPPRSDGLNMYFTIRDEMVNPYTNTILRTVRRVPEIDRVIFNYPATIVVWKDNTKTVVKCSENDQYDEETGLALCIAKKALGNKGNWYNEFKKWLPESSNLDSDAVLAEITKAAREANFKTLDRDRINDVIQMIEFNSKSPLRLPVMLTPDAAETMKDVLKQIMASIS